MTIWVILPEGDNTVLTGQHGAYILVLSEATAGIILKEGKECFYFCLINVIQYSKYTVLWVSSKVGWYSNYDDDISTVVLKCLHFLPSVGNLKNFRGPPSFFHNNSYDTLTIF